MKLTGFFIAFFLISGTLLGQKEKTGKIKLQDGSYSGYSQSGYIAEPYWGIINFDVKDGKITDLRFMIRDSALHETFNAEYAIHFAGNDLYIQQTKNDWNGVQAYPLKLLKKQNIDKVDAITGATWSYNIFKDSFLDALKSK